MRCPAYRGAIYKEVEKLRDETQELENQLWAEFGKKRDQLQAACEHTNTSVDSFTGDEACWDCGKWL